MSDLKAHVSRLLDRLRADADLPYEDFVTRWVPQPVAQMPARAREAVARYLPGEPPAAIRQQAAAQLPGEPAEPSFARMLGAYARCNGACLDRAEGNAECWEICRRAKAAARQAPVNTGIPAVGSFF